jgi:hypothetical protein
MKRPNERKSAHHALLIMMQMRIKYVADQLLFLSSLGSLG